MRIIELNNLKANEVIKGYALITSYSTTSYGQGKTRALGSLTTKNKTMDWTSFDNKVVNYFMGLKINNILDIEDILYIEAKVSEYNGKLSLVINKIDFEPTSLTVHDFMKSINVPKVYEELIGDVRANLSKNYQKVFSLLLKDYKDVYIKTYGGAKMHDAQVGGLMNHSYKMFKIALTLLSNDDRLTPFKDELLLGTLIHDFGKTVELDLNKYTKNSFVTHRTLGVEILALRRGDIISHIGEDAYYRLLAIIQGHHGEQWGDKPTTMIAQVVHYIDLLESQTTCFLDIIENELYQVQENGNKAIKYDGNNLVI